MNRLIKIVVFVCLCVVFLNSFDHVTDDAFWTRYSMDKRINVIPKIVVGMEESGAITVHRDVIEELVGKGELSPFKGTMYVVDQIVKPVVDDGDRMADQSVADAKIGMWASGIAILCLIGSSCFVSSGKHCVEGSDDGE